MKFRVYVDTGFAGGIYEDEIEIDDEQWNDMSEKEKRDWTNETAKDFLWNFIEYGEDRIDDNIAWMNAPMGPVGCEPIEE